MDRAPASAIHWLFDGQLGAPDRLIPRWLFLRGFGLIYFSAFFSLIFQIRGLIGPEGILPAQNYLQAVGQTLGSIERLWYAPTLLWFSSGPVMLIAVCWVGMAASVLLVLNVWPRGMLAICFICYLSFVSAAQDFSGYQSDGMLLEAGFISLLFAPSGFRPRLGAAHPASRASLFLLQWEWFRIYFESGAVKLLSGDPEWRHFTAMDEYYQNGPLPTWIGWYVQHLPHWFHAATVVATFALELGIVWMMFLPRRWRIACFFIATAWQVPVIVTANYTFLNYLVLLLGVLLLDDGFILRVLPEKWESRVGRWVLRPSNEVRIAEQETRQAGSLPELSRGNQPGSPFRLHWRAVKLTVSTVMLSWVFYATAVQLIWMFLRIPLPTTPVSALEPFRIANQYGLFAVMTRGRYEIEFQGSNDGQNWATYPFLYKPQDPGKAPGIYAPYQPRFDWNLWFASLGSWREYPIVGNTEVRLIDNNKDVLALFAGDPFATAPPKQIRAVLWQYWFTTLSEKRATGMWWRRQLLGLYAPRLEREPDGSIKVVEWPRLTPKQ